MSAGVFLLSRMLGVSEHYFVSAEQNRETYPCPSIDKYNLSCAIWRKVHTLNSVEGITCISYLKFISIMMTRINASAKYSYIDIKL